MMRRLRMTVEYDGTGLVGWQKQNNGLSVQEHLENALFKILATPTEVLGASRTDAGVHALGQVASFTTSKDIPTIGFLRGLNTYLPDTIALQSCSETPLEFHPRFEATGKTYRYKLLIKEVPSPLWRHRSWRRKHPLDVAAMQKAANSLLGEHDFSAFRASGCGAKHPRRLITSIKIVPNDPFVDIVVQGNAFLRHMVRILSGTLVEVGEGIKEVEHVKFALQSKLRKEAGVTAPPQGLYLERVHYV